MSTTCDRTLRPLLHRAIFYSSREELLDILAARTRGRIDERDPVLISVDPESEAQLRKMLDDDADTVDFVDPGTLSGDATNRVIRRFVATARQAASTGPVSVLVQHPFDRSDDEARLRLECEVNAALEGIPVDLVCLYDLNGRDTAALAAARGDVAADDAPDLGAAYDVHLFDHLDSSSLRGWLYFHSAVAGLPETVADEFVLAVHEAAMTASACTASQFAATTVGGQGFGHRRVPVRIWPRPEQMTCEVVADETPQCLRTNSALWLVDRACPSVRIDVRDDRDRHEGTEGSRIRVHTASEH